MSTTKDEVMEQLSRVLTIVPKQYIDALLALHKKLDENVEWAVGGDLAEALRTVKVNPNCVEILTSKEGAEQIAQAVEEFDPSEIAFRTQQLGENAKIEGKEYPVYIRSYYFDFRIDATKVKIHGDLQFRVNSWDWGDKLKFTPEYVYITDKKTAVLPLSVAYELYQLLGWTDRVEKIRQVMAKRQPRAQQASREG